MWSPRSYIYSCQNDARAAAVIPPSRPTPPHNLFTECNASVGQTALLTDAPRLSTHAPRSVNRLAIVCQQSRLLTDASRSVDRRATVCQQSRLSAYSAGLLTERDASVDRRLC